MKRNFGKKKPFSTWLESSHKILLTSYQERCCDTDYRMQRVSVSHVLQQVLSTEGTVSKGETIKQTNFKLLQHIYIQLQNRPNRTTDIDLGLIHHNYY